MKKIIAIALVLIMSLSIMTMAVSAAPAGLESLAVVGDSIPGVPAWAPEAAEGNMTEVSEGIFEKTLDCPAGTSMKLKIAGNDKWDDNWNFGSATIVLGQKADLTNGAGSTDMPLTIDKACKIKITVDVNGLANGAPATILVEEVTSGGTPTPTQPTTTQPTTTKPAPNGTRTLTIKVPSTWTKVYIYTWEPEEFGTFPGAVVQKSGNEYKVSVKNSMTNLIVTGEKADTTKQQTDNITLKTAGGNVIVTVAEDGKATVTYAEAGTRKDAAEDPTTPLSNYRVVGDAAWMGSWDAASDLGRMHDMGGNVYRVNFDNVEPGSYALKITKDGKWDNAYGTEDGQNFTFTVDQKCKITVDFTIKADGKHVIEVYGAGVPQLSDVSMLSVVILLALASVTAVVLVVNKKKFI